MAVKPFSMGVVTNVEGAVNVDAARVKSLLVKQVVSPVRWEESVRCLKAMGCEGFVEVGPGRVLSGLIRRIDPSLKVQSIETPVEVDGFANHAERPWV